MSCSELQRLSRCLVHVDYKYGTAPLSRVAVSREINTEEQVFGGKRCKAPPLFCNPLCLWITSRIESLYHLPSILNSIRRVHRGSSTAVGLQEAVAVDVGSRR